MTYFTGVTRHRTSRAVAYRQRDQQTDRQTHTGRQTDRQMKHVFPLLVNTKPWGKHQTTTFLCVSFRTVLSRCICLKTLKSLLGSFQVAGRRDLMCLYRLTTSGLIIREAATSEHCVESPRHTEKESALYLFTPPYFSLSLCQQTASVRGSRVGTLVVQKK